MRSVKIGFLNLSMVKALDLCFLHHASALHFYRSIAFTHVLIHAKKMSWLSILMLAQQFWSLLKVVGAVVLQMLKSRCDVWASSDSYRCAEVLHASLSRICALHATGVCWQQWHALARLLELELGLGTVMCRGGHCALTGNVFFNAVSLVIFRCLLSRTI